MVFNPLIPKRSGVVEQFLPLLKLLSHQITLSFLQRQSELQQSGGAGAAEAAGEAEGGGGGHGAQRRGAGQPAHPTSHGPQKPQQALPGLAGLGVDLRESYACSLPASAEVVSWSLLVAQKPL